jgi:hypothetical protein
MNRTGGTAGRESEGISAEKFASLSSKEKNGLHQKWIISN